jgi:hypothetical protein
LQIPKPKDQISVDERDERDCKLIAKSSNPKN